MQIKAYGKSYEIPEKMIEGFMIELHEVTQPGYREDLEHVREMTGLVLDTIEDDPDLMEHKEYEDDFIKAHAMRQALAKYGILFDA
mgnify:CR=1 FL=1